jgi:hypothetical protein
MLSVPTQKKIIKPHRKVVRMTRRQLVAAVIGLTVTFSAGTMARQSVPSPSGHWVGTLEAGQSIAVEIDLARQGADAWRGTISIPAQGQKGLPLSDLIVKNTSVEFAIKGGMGAPAFKGELSADGKTIAGTFSQGGGSLPLTLSWKGEPQFEAVQKNPAVSKAVLGTWDATLDVKGTPLRLALTLTNGPDGAVGTLVSVDQNNFEAPVSKITEEGSRLKLAITMVSGGFEGDVKDGEIAGTWTQGPLSLPLVFKRRQ